MYCYVKNVFGKMLRFNAMLGVMGLCLIAIGGDASALTAQTVMANALEVYADVEDYAAVVHTYTADSMEVSGSVFEGQPPRVAFNLFFRKPDAHAVKAIGDARRGIFRIELLSTLMRLTRLEVRSRGQMFLLGHACHVLEIVDPDTPGDTAMLWISPGKWKVLQLTLFIKSVELVRTQFMYAPDDTGNPLPVETRSFFPVSNQILINRIGAYRVNTGLPAEIFEPRHTEGATQ